MICDAENRFQTLPNLLFCSFRSFSALLGQCWPSGLKFLKDIFATVFRLRLSGCCAWKNDRKTVL